MLALRYRPTRFSDLVGQVSARIVLQAMVHSGRVPPAMLFRGPSGTGKTSAARILAAALNCAQPVQGDACGDCDSCREVQDGNSLSVHEMDAATSGGVDDIRALRELAQYQVSGNWRVFLLDEAHSLTPQAFNALLKLMEEPPTRSVFVLLTTEPERILETVRTRSMPVDFRPISEVDVLARVRDITIKEGLGVPDDVLKGIAEASEGGLRESLVLLDQVHLAGIATLAELRTLTGRSDIPGRIVQALVVGEPSKARQLLHEFLTSSSDLAELISGLIEDLQERFDHNTVGPDRLTAAMRLLWDARTLTGSPRFVRSQIEAMMVLLMALFRDSSSPSPILQVKDEPAQKSQKSVNGQRKLSFEEMFAEI